MKEKTFSSSRYNCRSPFRERLRFRLRFPRLLKRRRSAALPNASRNSLLQIKRLVREAFGSAALLRRFHKNFCRFFFMSLMSLLSFVSCSYPYEILDVHNDFLTVDKLASAHASTPDPRLECPTVGQRLRINWNIGADFYSYQSVKLIVNVRLYDRTDDKVEVDLFKPSGTYLYFVVNEIYCRTGGMSSYKIQLLGDGSIIDEWIHPLWQDRIQVGEST